MKNLKKRNGKQKILPKTIFWDENQRWKNENGLKILFVHLNGVMNVWGVFSWTLCWVLIAYHSRLVSFTSLAYESIREKRKKEHWHSVGACSRACASENIGAHAIRYTTSCLKHERGQCFGFVYGRWRGLVYRERIRIYTQSKCKQRYALRYEIERMIRVVQWKWFGSEWFRFYVSEQF